jgi:hypothetical protein
MSYTARNNLNRIKKKGGNNWTTKEKQNEKKCNTNLLLR